MTNTIINIFLFSIILSACNSQNSLPSDNKKEQIIFGSGGGFTGKVMEYTLLKNGELFLNNTLKNENNKIKTLSKSETKEIFNKIKLLNIEKIQFKHPGNMYYFVKLKSKESINEVIWGDNKFSEPNEIKEFYKLLISKVQ